MDEVMESMCGLVGSSGHTLIKRWLLALQLKRFSVYVAARNDGGNKARAPQKHM